MPRHSEMGVPQEQPSVGGPGGSFTERRNKPRVTEPLPARAWGVDAGGTPFSIDCVLDNVSPMGLYLKVPVEMNVGSTISLMVRLLEGPRGRSTATIRGNVSRCDPEPDDMHGIAVAISELRFL